MVKGNMLDGRTEGQRQGKGKIWQFSAVSSFFSGHFANHICRRLWTFNDFTFNFVRRSGRLSLRRSTFYLSLPLLNVIGSLLYFRGFIWFYNHCLHCSVNGWLAGLQCHPSNQNVILSTSWFVVVISLSLHPGHYWHCSNFSLIPCRLTQQTDCNCCEP